MCSSSQVTGSLYERRSIELKAEGFGLRQTTRLIPKRDSTNPPEASIRERSDGVSGL